MQRLTVRKTGNTMQGRSANTMPKTRTCRLKGRAVTVKGSEGAKSPDSSMVEQRTRNAQAAGSSPVPGNRGSR